MTPPNRPPKPDYVSAPTRIRLPIPVGWIVFTAWVIAEFLLPDRLALRLFVGTVALMSLCAVLGARTQGRRQ